MPRRLPHHLLRRLAVIGSGALLIAACQQAQTAAVPGASPPPIADTRATATLLPTYTQPVLGAGVPASPAPGGAVGAPAGGAAPGGGGVAPGAGAAGATGAGTGAAGGGTAGGGAGTGTAGAPGPAAPVAPAPATGPSSAGGVPNLSANPPSGAGAGG